MDSADDWMDGHDGDDADGTRGLGSFGIYPDSECFRCSDITGRRTAELLYMSSEWDYYYCYRCRGWFKKPFMKRHVVLPVNDRDVIKNLTWMYTSQMEAAYQNRKMLEWVERAVHVLERRLMRA